VPGNITSPTSAGTNNLIKAGATPVTSVEDIFEALGVKMLSNNEQTINGDTPEETTILKLINDGVISGNEIFQECKMNTEDYQRHLTMLEIKGRIKPLGNDKWSLI
jgi:DNA processing protein